MIFALIKRFSRRDAVQIRFEEFFGQGSLVASQPGRIVLQTIRVNEKVEELFANDKNMQGIIHDRWDKPKGNRFYKARTWINARDAEGARVLREELRRQGFPQLELTITDIESTGDPAPYVISMGLGFSTQTDAVLQVIDPNKKTIRIDNDSPDGDIVVIYEGELETHYTDILERTEVVADGSPFRPHGWDLREWLDTKNLDSKDYALIIRHNNKERRQVQFVLAGFTEDGTAAAEKYLANQWSYLWEKFVRDKTGTEGDFVIVIGGTSRGKKAWRQKPAIEIKNSDLAKSDD